MTAVRTASSILYCFLATWLHRSNEYFKPVLAMGERMGPGCTWVEKPWQEQGQRVYQAILQRSRKDPWFAAVSAVLQAGRITYGPQQRYVERLSQMGYQTFLGRDGHMRALNALRGAQMGKSKAIRIQKAAQCYAAHCKLGECIEDNEARTLMSGCLAGPAGIGRKPSYLFRLYAGDREAVPSDRHVCRYVVNTLKVESIPFKNDDARAECMPSDNYKPLARNPQKVVEQAMKRAAHSCGIPPARYMVPVWLKGACHGRAVPRDRKGGLLIEGDTRVMCDRAKTLEKHRPLETYAKQRVKA